MHKYVSCCCHTFPPPKCGMFFPPILELAQLHHQNIGIDAPAYSRRREARLKHVWTFSSLMSIFAWRLNGPVRPASRSQKSVAYRQVVYHRHSGGRQTARSATRLPDCNYLPPDSETVAACREWTPAISKRIISALLQDEVLVGGRVPTKQNIARSRRPSSCVCTKTSYVENRLPLMLSTA